MREIKFRAWMENKMLSHEDLVDMDQEFYAMYTILTEPQEDITFMQYTGLKDKDGREIYEGDLVKNSRCGSNQLMHVKWSDAIEEVSSDGVEWTRQKPGFVFEKISKGMTYVFVASKDLEVIGNIYENPELLEESQNGTK